MNYEIPQHAEPTPEGSIKPSIIFGTYLPETTLTNQDIESWLRNNRNGRPLSAKAIGLATGVESRYVASEEETPLLMGLEAAQQVLSGKKADAIIVSTSFPQGFNVSGRIAEELGLSSAFNLDVHAACSGFARSLTYLKENEEKHIGQQVLLIATEKYSPFLHDLKTEGRNSDPSLAQALFSDGAYAMVFELGKDIEILSALNHRFPKDVSNLIEMPVDPKLMSPPFINGPIPYPESGKFEQKGGEVVKVISSNIGSLIEKAVTQTNLKPSDIKKVFPHQGSRPTTEAVEKALSEYHVYRDFEEGNFSSGSIPKALMKAVNHGEIERGDNLVLAGFGAGMFASIAVVRLN